MKIYFAHPVNTYNTPIEKAAVESMQQRFPNAVIENPNQPCHQEGYKNWSKRQKESDTKHKGMSYFYDEVLPKCNGCVAMPFLDDRLGLGVAGEAKWFHQNDCPIWIIKPTVSPSGTIFLIHLIFEKEIQQLVDGHLDLVVPHEETRLRTWKVYNQVRRPYEEAHLVKMPIPEGFYSEETKTAK